jgi:hypothetical protein
MTDKSTTVHINSENININDKQLKIMIFLTNAVEKGWSVKKKDGQFIFSKKHENKKEIFQEEYLETFIQSNFDMNLLQHT